MSTSTVRCSLAFIMIAPQPRHRNDRSSRRDIATDARPAIIITIVAADSAELTVISMAFVTIVTSFVWLQSLR